MLPNIIEKHKIHLATSGISLKLLLGPITSPSPGPTFEIAVAAPEIDEIKSRPVKDKSIEIIKNIIKNKKTNEIIEDICRFPIFSLL